MNPVCYTEFLMNETFSADFFIGNRKRLFDVIDGQPLIVLTAHGQLQRSADNTFAFQQDSSFWYLTGVEYADVIVVIEDGTSYAIIPSRGTVREAFDGAIDVKKLQQETGIDEVLDENAGWDRLSGQLKKVHTYATLAPNPPYFDAYGVYANPARAALADRIKGINSALETIDIRQDVARLRMVKQPLEIKALQTAIDITIDTMLEVMQPAVLANYTHEYQIDADLTRGFRYKGARGHAFDPIVAGGANATTLHNVANDAPLNVSDLVVLDVGAEYKHYCADITRTVSVGGKPSERQQAVHRAVLEMQEYAIGQIKAGILLKEYEKDIEQKMGEKLIELGLITENTHENVRTYYPHSTSHFLGIDPHDAGDYSMPLPEGAVITVEPGIYIPEEGIGVRIEDDVFVTENGCTVLSGKLPKALTLS